MAGAWADPPHRGCGADRLFDRLLHVRFMQMVSPVCGVPHLPYNLLTWYAEKKKWLRYAGQEIYKYSAVFKMG